MTRLRARGMTLIELLVAFAVLAISLIGIASLQIASSHMNQMSERLAIASALATDLIENATLWSYTDPRLNASDTITSTTATIVGQRSILVSGITLNTTSTPTFAEGSGTPSALTNNALYGGTTLYQGYTQSQVSGSVPFQRYWSVFNYTSPVDGNTNGKLVVVTVLWYEPAAYGYKEVTASTFISDPATMAAGIPTGGT